MKKILLINILLLFCACDPRAIHEYYIQNNCEDVIVINILDYKDNSSSIDIAPNMERLIYTGETIGDVYEDGITYFIKDITVKKGDVISQKNLLDFHIWHFEKIGRYHAKSSLTINPEDFE